MPAAMQRLLLALLSVALLAAATPGAASQDPATAESPEINPRYLLVGSKGQAVTNEDFPGRFQLITFGYTYCPDICPTTLAAMAQILGYLGGKAARLQPIFVSVDPERDTPEAISRYTHYFDPRIVGLTGTPDLVRHAADHFQVTYRKYAEPGAAPMQYSVDHSAGMYLLGPHGDFIARFAYSTAPRDIAARIEKIMAADRDPAAGCAAPGAAQAKCARSR
jgi:protein SCO1/2